MKNKQINQQKSTQFLQVYAATCLGAFDRVPLHCAQLEVSFVSQLGQCILTHPPPAVELIFLVQTKIDTPKSMQHKKRKTIAYFAAARKNC